MFFDIPFVREFALLGAALPFLAIGVNMCFFPPGEEKMRWILTSRRVKNKTYLTEVQIFARRKKWGTAMIAVFCVLAIINFLIIAVDVIYPWVLRVIDM